MAVEIKRIAYGGWPNCYSVSDGTVELVATSDVGPRIIRLGFANEPNLFAELPETLGKTGGESWNIYGGHRLWHSPETRGRTYYPDNFPIEVQASAGGIRLKQPVEPNTGIEKEIIITVDPKNHNCQIEHHLTNRNNWPVTFAPWAISVMRPDGVGIVPQTRKPDEEGMLPNRVLSLWPYTDMNDTRVTWGNRYILLAQDRQKKDPFKFGLSVPEGWAAYAWDGYLFMKKFAYDPVAIYPDGNVNYESYTSDTILEVETLGPLQTLNPGSTAGHVETWHLFKNIGKIETEADVEKIIIPLIK
ncbi:MAG: hypothetical protein ACM3WV_11440 [Bacillota bacterium]